MNREIYPVIKDLVKLKFTFFSIGPKGVIPKVIQFIKIADDYFNLTFGDWHDAAEKIEDFVRTNNKDRDKVLATVASVVLEFTNYFPNAIIMAQGSTPARTRLYQMGINAEFDFIIKIFTIEGFAGGEWRTFEKHKNYSAFRVKKKQINLTA